MAEKKPFFFDWTTGAVGTYSAQYRDKSRPDNVRIEYYTLGVIPHKVLTDSVPINAVIPVDSPFKDVKGVQNSYVFVVENSEGTAKFLELVLGRLDKVIKNIKEENERLKREVYKYKDQAKLAEQEKERIMAYDKGKKFDQEGGSRQPSKIFGNFEDL